MTPTRTSGWPKEAPSPATMMSACIASSQPPPSARPFTAATTGFGQAAIAFPQAMRVPQHHLDRAALGEIADICAGCENPLGAGEHDATHVRIAAQFGEVFGEHGAHLQVQRVARVGAG